MSTSKTKVETSIIGDLLMFVYVCILCCFWTFVHKIDFATKITSPVRVSSLIHNMTEEKHPYLLAIWNVWKYLLLGSIVGAVILVGISPLFVMGCDLPSSDLCRDTERFMIGIVVVYIIIWFPLVLAFLLIGGIEMAVQWLWAFIQQHVVGVTVVFSVCFIAFVLGAKKLFIK